jgi:RNA polymerase sigma factor for flagellar operon FliA
MIDTIYRETLDDLEARTNEELFTLYQRSHDNRIKQELTMRYIYIVKSVAYQMRDVYSDTMQPEDIINEGVIEIMKAIDRYDIEKDNKFETFISRRIRGMVIDLIRKNDWMPRNYHRDRKNIEDARDELQRKLGHAPSDEEISKYYKMDVKKIKKVDRMRTMVNVLSLDMTYDDNDETLFQVASDDINTQPEGSFLQGETVATLARAIDSLKDSEKKVISLYYVDELNMNQIAEVMNISQPRVSQLHSIAIEKLKGYMAKMS